jgi:hypothetical protein
MHVAPIGTQINDGIAHNLAGAVVGDIAASAGFVKLDAELREPPGCREDMTPIVADLDPERDNGRVLEQEQLVRDRAAPALLDELLLEDKAVRVRNATETANLENPLVLAHIDPSDVVS